MDEKTEFFQTVAELREDGTDYLCILAMLAMMSEEEGHDCRNIKETIRRQSKGQLKRMIKRTRSISEEAGALRSDLDSLVEYIRREFLRKSHAE